MKLIKRQAGLVRKKNTPPPFFKVLTQNNVDNHNPNRILHHERLELVQNARDAKHIRHVV